MAADRRAGISHLAPPPEGAATQADLRKWKGPDVLLVEDDDVAIDLLTLGLEHAGFFVRTASSLGAAWHKLAESTPDALILDNRLPDGAGLGLCRRIRGDARLNGLFVAILTADAAVVQKTSWLDAGADTCWAKPVSAQQLAALVKGELRSKARPASPLVRLGPGAWLDRARKRLVSHEWESQELNDNEARFVELFQAAGEVGREDAAAAARVGAEGPDRDLALNAFIFRLRKKLPKGVEVIVTIPGRGFRMVAV